MRENIIEKKLGEKGFDTATATRTEYQSPWQL